MHVMPRSSVHGARSRSQALDGLKLKSSHVITSQCFLVTRARRIPQRIRCPCAQSSPLFRGALRRFSRSGAFAETTLRCSHRRRLPAIVGRRSFETCCRVNPIVELLRPADHLRVVPHALRRRAGNDEVPAIPEFLKSTKFQGEKAADVQLSNPEDAAGRRVDAASPSSSDQRR